MTKHVWILLIAVVLMVGCEGPMGPTGPQGAKGVKGDTGDAGQDFQYYVGTGTIDAKGYCSLLLPSYVGSLYNPPFLTCYMSEVNSDLWYVIGLDLVGPSALIVWDGYQWRVWIVDGEPGWLFRVVAAW